MLASKLDAELLERFYARLHRCRELCSGRPPGRPAEAVTLLTLNVCCDTAHDHRGFILALDDRDLEILVAE
jgi:hypothetical protein